MVHTGEEKSGAGPVIQQNRELSDINIDYEFGIRVGIISYTCPVTPPVYLSPFLGYTVDISKAQSLVHLLWS